jgi:hypothetical protein
VLERAGLRLLQAQETLRAELPLWGQLCVSFLSKPTLTALFNSYARRPPLAGLQLDLFTESAV